MHFERLEYDRTDMAFLMDKVANSPAGPAYQSYVAWNLAGKGHEAEAKQHLRDWFERDLAFDANWLSAQAEAAEAIVLLDDPTYAQRLLRPTRPVRWAPGHSGRAVMSYGAIDRHLGGLAAVLGRRDEAIAHLHAAIDRNAELAAPSGGSTASTG